MASNERNEVWIRVEKRRNGLLTREQSRRADETAIQKFCIPSLVLMENAGRNCAEALIESSHSAPPDEQAVVVLCGPGNNGGDGFVIARHLYIAGMNVAVVLFRPAEEYSGDAHLNLNSLSQLQMKVFEFDFSWSDDEVQSVFATVGQRETTWIVDALLGTGASGEPREPMARAIRIANQMNVRRFAVDIPTGLDCDTGEAASTAFCADVTCTMIDRKAGFENPRAAEYTGKVVVVGIGAPDEIVG